METRANHALIGLFTLAVFLIGFAFVWWFAGGSDSSQRNAYRIIFQGSVSGLTRGSGVLFNGIRVGDVLSLELDPKDPQRVIARVSVDAATPIRSDTKARLEYQGLTGVAAVQLEGGKTDAAILPTSWDEPATIVAERSAVQDLLEGARKVMTRADGIMETVETFVTEAREPLIKSLSNVERFTQAVAGNSDQIENFLKATGEAATKISQLSGRLEGLTEDLRNIVQAVDPKEVDAIVGNFTAFSDGLAKAAPRIDTVFADAAAIASDLRGVSARLETTFTRVDQIVEAVDAQKIRGTVNSVSAFAQTLDNNRGNVDDIVKDAAQLTERLNEASKKLDNILDGANSLIGGAGGEGGGLQEFSDTAKAIRTLAENLDQRTALLSRDISGFTGRGLRQIDAFTSQGTRTLTEIERVMREFERNPRRFLFGGSSIPEYSQRR
jgi:phospholipid/cholesterol/gamma-HCH transport system substrate-binding protein